MKPISQWDDTYILLFAFGIVFLLNVISLILVYVTPYGKDYLKSVKNNSIGYQVFWHIYFLIVGVCFWPTVGISKLIELIRNH